MRKFTLNWIKEWTNFQINANKRQSASFIGYMLQYYVGKKVTEQIMNIQKFT